MTNTDTKPARELYDHALKEREKFTAAENGIDVVGRLEAELLKLHAKQKDQTDPENLKEVRAFCDTKTQIDLIPMRRRKARAALEKALGVFLPVVEQVRVLLATAGEAEVEALRSKIASEILRPYCPIFTEPDGSKCDSAWVAAGYCPILGHIRVRAALPVPLLMTNERFTNGEDGEDDSFARNRTEAYRALREYSELLLSRLAEFIANKSLVAPNWAKSV